MTDDDEVTYLVVLRAAWGVAVMPRSVPIRANCGHPGFIAPTGQAFLATPAGAGSYVICTDCALASVPPDRMSSVPGAMAELEAELPPGRADQVAAFMRDHDIQER